MCAVSVARDSAPVGWGVVTPADRLAEAARKLCASMLKYPDSPALGDFPDALAAYDADKARRDAEQAVIEAAGEIEQEHAMVGDGYGKCSCRTCAAVRRLRELEQENG